MRLVLLVRPVAAGWEGRRRVWRRRVSRSFLILGLGCLLGGPPAVGQADVTGEFALSGSLSDSLKVRLLRTWQPDGLTIVDGLANVPLAMLAGGTTGTYRFEISIADAAGNSLYRDSWERELSEQAAAFVEASATDLLETFRFGVAPGDYVVEVRAYPTDAPDLGTRLLVPLVAFGEKPDASDLILASRVEPVADGAGGGSWSITHGDVGINAAARSVVLAEEPDLFYYIEFYGYDSAEAFEARAHILSGDRMVFRTAAMSVEVPPEGLPFTGRVSLAGLPPGQYSLAMVLEGAGSFTRTATFTMLGPGGAAVVAGRVQSEEANYFSSLSDTELLETFGGVSVLVTQSERLMYEAFPPIAKRAYLAEFFAKNDPDPASAGNAFLDEYIERIGVIRARWGETVGESERLPWTTDMGRIFLIYGDPPERVINYSPDPAGDSMNLVGGGSYGGEPPYEIWRYSSTSFVYMFIEENQFNAWRLVYSSDPDIASLADWYRRVGPQAMSDLRNFGINPS